MAPRDPDGYAYLYPGIGGGRIIRFNGGEEVNGSRPECSLPYWLGNDEQSDQMDALRAENAALRERLAVLERVREAAIVADDFVWGGGGALYLDPKTTVPWVGQFHKVRDELREALAAAKPAAQRPTPSPETLAERAPPPPADLVQATQDGEHPAIHAKGAEGVMAVRMPMGKGVADKSGFRPAKAADLEPGAEVWYSTIQGGTMSLFRSVVEGRRWCNANGQVLVNVRDLDPDYGAEAIATPLQCIFVRRKEAADGN